MYILPPVMPPLNPINVVTSNIESFASLVNSIEKICVSNNMCAIEQTRIHLVTEIACKKIKTKCMCDISNILNDYDYIKHIFASKSLSDVTKEEIISKIIENIQNY